MTAYWELMAELGRQPRSWLVTGAAGFIGSNLLEALLMLDQTVVGLDNFATGYASNLEDVKARVTPEAWVRFRFIEGDIRDLATCRSAVEGIQVVLHQAALGSVPRSIQDPLASHQANVDGSLNLMLSARDVGARLVYASSSSVYGDNADLPKLETRTGKPLSPYALTKSVVEQYARILHLTYGFGSIGLRYFNVFGPRQNKNGPYAAVIPRWITSLLDGTPTAVYGDGETSRDFCFVKNVVQANLLAGCSVNESALGQIFNVSCGGSTRLNDLHVLIREGLSQRLPGRAFLPPEHQPNRPGDIRHSQADISAIGDLLGYQPQFQIQEGLGHTLDWFCARAVSRPEPPQRS
jgi:UDP-N-acetylglucosamine 4-epimerase